MTLKRRQHPRVLLYILVILSLASFFRLVNLRWILTLSSSDEFHWDHPIVATGVSNNTFSACLLTYDDNHFLIEWLAFHYQTLPLRRLILATDPRSRTTPSEIVQRWQSFMNITEWNDNDYFPLSYRKSILKSKVYTNTTDRLVLMHRYRQRFFYEKCMKTLHAEGGGFVNSSSTSSSEGRIRNKNWVALLDVDEFLFPNRNWMYANLLPPRKDNDNYDNGYTFATVAQALHRIGSYSKYRGPCLGLPRLLIGSKKDSQHKRTITVEENLLKNQVEGLLTELGGMSSPRHPELLTLTWVWHGKLISHERNKAGKAILDLSSIPSNLIRLNEVDVHRPIMNVCTTDDMWTTNPDSPLVLHHYTGSFEQFTFRNDPREGKRTLEAFKEYDDFNVGTVDPKDVYSWLLQFVENVGMEQAKILLKGVGEVERNAPPPLNQEDSYMTLYNAIFPSGETNSTATSNVTMKQLGSRPWNHH